MLSSLNKLSKSNYLISPNNLIKRSMGWCQEKIVAVGFPMDQHSDEFYKLNKMFVQFAPIHIGETISLVPSILTSNKPNYDRTLLTPDPKYHRWYDLDKPKVPNGKIFLIKMPHKESVKEILINSINGPYDYNHINKNRKPRQTIDEYENQKKIIKQFLTKSGIDIDQPAHIYQGNTMDKKYFIEKDFYDVPGYKDAYQEWLIGKNLSLPYEHYIGYYEIGLL